MIRNNSSLKIKKEWSNTSSYVVKGGKFVSKLDRRIERTKRDIKLAFLELIQQYNLEEVTIKEITNLANYNRATFYAHYHDKNMLIQEISEDALKGLIDAIQQSYAETAILNLQNLTVTTVKIFDYIANHKLMFSLLFNPNKFPDFQTQFCEVLKQILEKDSYYLSPTFEKLDRNIWEYTECYATAGMITYWIKNGYKQSPEFMATQLIERLKFKPTLVKYQRNTAFEK